MKKITKTAKELGIKFCQDCGFYSREFCNKFNSPTDPGELTCSYFIHKKKLKTYCEELRI